MQAIEEVSTKMQKVLDNLTKELSAIRSGRAHPRILENIKVSIYDQSMPLNAVSTIGSVDSKTLVVTVWDPTNVEIVDKFLRRPPLGFNPRVEGNKLFVSIPPVTEERRMDLIKLVKQKEEDAKIAVRNVRRDVNHSFKEAAKSQKISKDQEDLALKKVQDLTDKMVRNVVLISERKQEELRDF